MRRVITLIAMVAILFGVVAACGSSSKTTSAATPASPTATGSASEAASPTGSCASAGTRKIPKTRLLADLALTYGAFHRYLYKPYKAGSFHSGAQGRS